MKKPRIQIHTCTVAEIENARGIGDVSSGYAEESAISLLPAPQPRWDVYRAMEVTGLFKVIGAFDGERIVGFASVISGVMMPHYGVKLASVESIFVLKGYRKTGAGIRLLRAAEDVAREEGAVALLSAAPKGGSLAKVLPGLGYASTHDMFCRRIA